VVYRVMLPRCSLVGGYEHFRETHCIHLQGLALYDIPGDYNLLMNHISTGEIKMQTTVSIIHCLYSKRLILICFFQTIQYLARNKVLQTETRELASLSRGKIRPGEGDEWKNEQLYVPPLPPTNLRGCHLIKIQYDVYVRAGNFICFQVP
jgi:hypothetical protein